MITLGAFLVFVGAASIPVIYIYILSRWLEPEYKLVCPNKPAPEARPVTHGNVVGHPA